MNALTFAACLGEALLAGALIGIEHQWRQRMAGLRTHTLVAAGAALFVLLSGSFGAGDPSRVAAQVVSGVGFLGAGVIMRDGLNVTGINTAATLWCSAAAGSLAGAGLPGYALAGAAAVVAVNTGLRSVARRLDRRPGSGDEVAVPYAVEAVVAAHDEAHVRALLVKFLSGSSSRLHAVASTAVPEDGQVRLRAEITAEGPDSTPVETALARISMEPAVAFAWWRQAS
ncbi:membrane protein [Streptomyces spinoverrucosus]|uniref:Membrane protein n=1 Tax=Streptomyces spinoverrucosus TaxID=284043 RepID=A0A4Y3VVG6_9ACTN|nr:MgtC/SapB family protein [Streptomyces spinoverrucosus]GEC10258.1 membrane protein [Streptomyces spinoverrucosus]GHB97933.1 membrane protein [Streptomyces spinoverrucosus]